MIKVLNQYFPTRLFVLLATENVLILFGVWVAVFLHIGGFRLNLVPSLLVKALIITGICQVCLYYNGLYGLRAIASQLEVLVRLMQALGLASITLSLLYFFIPRARFGTGIVETCVMCIAVAIVLWRILIERLARPGGTGERVLLVGSGPIAHVLLREMRGRTDLHLTVVGVVSETGDEAQTRTWEVPCLGRLDALTAMIKQTKPDRVVMALQERRKQLPLDSLLAVLRRGVLIEEASALYEKLTGKVPVDVIHPSWLIFSDHLHKSAALRFYKRFFGFWGAFVGLMLLSPLMALIAIAIKLDSRGPVCYRQPRVGFGGRIFELIKFRSMQADAESKSGPVWAHEDDPRVTRVGRFLRKTHLDELPQLINVLWGDMNFVGPRPERPHFVKQLKQQIPFYEMRHTVCPGITGWAQVSRPYPRSVAGAKEKLQFDLFYIKNLTVSLDLLILFRTAKFVLFGSESSASDERSYDIQVLPRADHPLAEVHRVGFTHQNTSQHLPPTNGTSDELVPTALTVDVEDYFHVSAFRHVIPFRDWDRMESRVEQNTSRVLDLLAEFDFQATFFILGWVAERFPSLVRRIQAAGHELGCHSYAHPVIYDLTPAEFRSDTERALRAIEDAAGIPVHAYRAPSFSITPRSLWAIEILLELGFTIDCSIFPIHHDLYGFAGAPGEPFRICLNQQALLEFPLPTLTVGRWTLPVTGGGYLRQLPFEYQLRALKTIERREKVTQLYFHPWELDPEQPRLAAPLLSRLRHYRGLNQTAERLRRLLGLFPFNTVSEVIKVAEPVCEVELWKLAKSQGTASAPLIREVPISSDSL